MLICRILFGNEIAHKLNNINNNVNIKVLLWIGYCGLTKAI